MSQGIDLQRFFRWLNGDWGRTNRGKANHTFAPTTDPLEVRRLLTLNVWIDSSNRVQIEANDDLSQDIQLDYASGVQTYEIFSYNSASNFFVVSDASSGLTVTVTPYVGPGNPARLTIVENSDAVSSITMTTGNGADTVSVGESAATVFVNTADGSDTIVHRMFASDGSLVVDGGAGDDNIVLDYFFAGSLNISQSVFGTGQGSQLAIDTLIGVNAPTNFINVRSENVENVLDSLLAGSSNLTVTVNGFNGVANGGFLDRTALENLSIRPITLDKTAHVFGYESNDDIEIYPFTDGTNFIVGMIGPRLPVTNFYNMNAVEGILRLQTLQGDDQVKAAPGVENLVRISVEGGEGDDYISADATLLGGAGDDTLEGGIGNDSIDGGAGDDIIWLTGGTDTYVGGGGFDTVYMHGHGGFNHNLSITQDEGVPAEFFANGVSSTVTLTDIDQISVQGTAGNDELLVSGTSTTPVPIVAFMGAGDDDIATTSASAQHVVTGYGEAGQDVYEAGPGRDTFFGGADADTFYANDGEENDDVFDGGSGENVLAALGSDIFVLDIAGVLTLINGGTGSVSGYSVSRVDVLVIDPGNNTVRLQADAGDNTILVTDSTTNPTLPPEVVEVSGLMVPIIVTGLAPGDNLTVAGNAGSDSLTAKGSGGANMIFEGGFGMDTFHVLPSSSPATFEGDLADVVSLSGSLGPDFVSLTPAPGVYLLQLGLTTQTVEGVGRYVIETWGGEDEILVETPDDLDITVDAGEGDDVIDAGGIDSAGASVHIFGGDGLDLIAGPTLAFTVISGGLGNDLILLAGSATAFGDGGDDQITGGAGNDTIDGGDGNDILFGGAGDDSIATGPGLNAVSPGLGFDLVVGGPDADQFFWFAGDGDDVISGGGGDDAVSVFGADGGLNRFEVLRQGTGYEMVYNGVEGIFATDVSWLDVFAGIGTTAEAFVEDMSGITLDRLAFYFDLAATSDATVNGSVGDDDLMVASVPGFIGVVSIAGLSYQFRYLGEATGFATNLAVLGQDGDDVIKSTIVSPTITTIFFDGGVGDDFLSADATLVGGPGNDTLQGGFGDDSLVGGDGDDTFLVSTGTDTIDGGAGFDIVRLEGSAGAPNFFGIQQNDGVPAVIQVNALIATVELTDIDQISVQGSAGNDFVYVRGTSLTPIEVFATLGLGNDIVDSNEASIAQWTIAYGEGGDDYFLSGPGTDYFYGGDDYDLFDAMYASRNSFDYFDGGSGFNDLYVEGSAFGVNVITAIPSGYRVTNTSGTGATTALNVGFVFVDSAGSGVILNASDEDDLIRTFDSTSDLVPPLPQNEMLVTGMPGEIRIIGIEPSTFVEIHGQGGNDTFQSLGNAGVRLEFFGESGDDTFVVTAESRLAFFTGGAGLDSVDVTGTLGSDTILALASIPGEAVLVNGALLAEIRQAERLSIDALAENDLIRMSSVGADTGLIDFDFEGGDGRDGIILDTFTALPGSTFVVSGGSGLDQIFSFVEGEATFVAMGGGGDDIIESTSLRSELYGEEGDDELTGSLLSDLISGGDGNDTMVGGLGNDTLSGGSGQDLTIWRFDSGNDIVDGGTGEDALIFEGDPFGPNEYQLRSQAVFANLFEVLIAGMTIGGGEIEHIRMRGGQAGDVFSIGNLELTTITLVDAVLGDDTVADSVSVAGSSGNDFVIVSGGDEAVVSGLPWMVRVLGAAFSATTLVDGILVDGGLGEDTLVAALSLINPVLLTLKGGAGSDDIRVNAEALGDNENRVTVNSADDFFTDMIQLRNGRNLVMGGQTDVILVTGSENDDEISVLPDGGGRVEISLTPPGLVSSNDLTVFAGVVHVEGLGGHDRIVIEAELPATVWGGDGNDEIHVGPVASLVYGGSGNDLILGGIGNDTFYGGAGNDQMVGAEGNDQLYGEEGDDFLNGGLGNDALLGGADSDLLEPGPNGTLAPEFVDGGSGLDQVRFDMIGMSGLIGRTAGFLNVGDLGAHVPSTGFNAADVEDLLIYVDSQAPGSTGYDLIIEDLTGSQVNFARVDFTDDTDENTLVLRGTIASDVIDASSVIPPGGEPEAQVLMPWGTVWAFTPDSMVARNTLAIEGMEGDDVIKADDILNEGAFAWKISLDGGSGNDFLSADATIVGGDGNDTLQGGLGDDSLEGGLGDDVFLLSAGLDTFVGGGGFDIVHIAGSANGVNLIEIDQTDGSPLSVSVNSTLFETEVAGIEQISVQGGTARDELYLTGSSAVPIDLAAYLGAGDDVVDTSGNDSATQVVRAWGEAGNDVFLSGPGIDYFYGGDEYDIFVVSANSFDSTGWFDGGTGYNELVVDTPPLGTTTITAIPSGFEVFNTDYSGSTTALNIGNLVVNGGGGGIVINGSNNDDVIRTFDSTSDLVPPPTVGTLLIAGLGADIYINGIVAGQAIGIHGQGGNDTFQSLGNAQSNLTFYGNSGEDHFVITGESRLATFLGGDGNDRASLQGSEFSEFIELVTSAPNELWLSVDLNLLGVTTLETESVSVDALGGADEIQVSITEFGFEFLSYEFSGGAGDDIVNLDFGGGSIGHFTVYGGAGDDLIAGSSLATTQLLDGGLGNDQIEARSLASIFGGAGNDTLIGSEDRDFLSGDDGDDTIDGGMGNDLIFGGADQDVIYWFDQDGYDTVDGGSGQDSFLVRGAALASNSFELRADADQPLLISLRVNTYGITGGEIEYVALTGGGFGDSFDIGDLSTTAVTMVDTDFGLDTVADTLFVGGTMNNDTILLTGTDGGAAITGLPWLVRARGVIANGDTLVDGVWIDGHYGDDWIRSGIIASSPMLVTVQGGQGADLLEINTPALGDNTNRVTVYAGDDVFTDRILLTNGRNLVYGGPNDIIEIKGTENADAILASGNFEPGRVTFVVNGQVASNDLTNFEGIVHIDALGANDAVTLQNYAIATSVLGGLGNDDLDASGMASRVSLYGGSGDDSLAGGSGNDFLEGGAGYDELTGNGGFDIVEGGSEGDYIYWGYGDGIDYVDGGTGENTLVFAGAMTDVNRFVLEADQDPATSGRLILIEGAGMVNGYVDFASVQLVRMFGGASRDTFEINDLTGTGVTVVEADFGVDTMADSLIVRGTDNRDDVMLSGSTEAGVSGLPWSITARNAAFNGSLLVDTIAVDLGLGDDKLSASASLTAPVLLNLTGGRGYDEYRINTDALGSNPFRVTVDGTVGVSPDIIWLMNGRNRVLGGAQDVIMVEGSANNDTVALTQVAEGTLFQVNGAVSTNDLTDFLGVIHVDLMGGNDIATLSGYSVPTSVLGGAGADVVDAQGMRVPVRLYGGDGDDILQGGTAADSIEGGTGNDRLRGNAGFDSLFGGDGADQFDWLAGDGRDVVEGGEGNDRLRFEGAIDFENRITLTPASSNIPSTAAGVGMGNANLILVELAGNGSVSGGSIESVALFGGTVCDKFAIGNLETTDVRVVDVGIIDPQGEAVVSTYATNTPDAITVTADSPDQIGVNGLAVPVRIFGAQPNATAIVVHAGFGGDTVEVDPQAEAQAIIVIDGGAGNDSIYGGSLIIGGPGNNLLVGSDGPNTIVGGTGSDTIYGLGGDDKLFGDAEALFIDGGDDCDYFANLVILPTATGAADWIEGGDGHDFINGNVGADSIFGGEGNDEIGALAYDGIFFPEPGNDVIDAGEGDNCVFSGDGNDTVKAGDGSNRIVLGEGNDTATTGNGNNSVFGGAGNDTVMTGAGNDVVALGAGDDQATLASGNDIAWGEDGNDFLIGQYGNDSLYGGNGDDILWGGLKATQPLKRGQKHAPIEPNDGNDVLGGEGGFDRLDGGNGDNIMDAGADYIRETMIGSGGWDTAFIHKDEGKFQDVLKNHSKRYTLIPYGAMLIPVVPPTPVDCHTPIVVNVPNPLGGAQSKPTPKKKVVIPRSTVTRQLRRR